MRIAELADMFDLELTVLRYPNQNGRHIAKLDRVETKENKDSGILRGEYGTGKTPDEAIKDYCENIKGKWAVYNAYGDNRKEFGIPNTLEP